MAVLHTESVGSFVTESSKSLRVRGLTASTERMLFGKRPVIVEKETGSISS
jgi:hypothetical protein